MNNKSYKVLNHDYINAGGGNYVLVTTLMFKDLNTTEYIFTSDEGQTKTSVNFIQFEVDDNDIEGIIINTKTLTEIATNEDDQEIYDHCYQEFIKQRCIHYKEPMYLEYDELPQALKSQITPEYKTWLIDHLRLIATDGSTIMIDDHYTSSATVEVKAINDFIEYLEGLTDSHHDMSEIELLYDDYIDITFHEKTIKIRFGAVPYNELIDFLKTVVSEY